MKPRRIVWHHTADPSPAPQFSRVNEWHKKRKFPLSALGYYVGYHYLIEQDGTTKQARLDTEIGAHDQGENQNSLGLALAGDFTARIPLAQQAASAAMLVAQLHKIHHIPVTRIEPHRWDDLTECPGLFLDDNWLIREYLQREASLYHRLFLWLGEQTNLL